MWSRLLLLGIVGGAIPGLAADNIPVFDDEVVVTASLEAQQRRDLSATVDVLDRQEIEGRQVHQLADLLSTLPGMTVARSGSPGQVTSLFTRGTESDHTLVLWNGIRLNNPYFGGFNWAFLPTEGIDRVEVVRGPFSALYGSDALGGVVQVLSREGPGLALDIESGAKGYGRLALNGGFDRNALRLDFAGHLRRGEGEVENDFFDSDEIVARAMWSFDERTRLGVVSRVNDSRSGIPYNQGAASPSRRIGWQEVELALPFEMERGRWALEAQASTVSLDSTFEDQDDPFGFTAAATRSRGTRARSVVTYSGKRSVSFAIGAEGERLEVDDESNFGVTLEGANQETWALFGELVHESGPLRLDLGLRRDENDGYGGQVSPRTGLVLALTPRSRLRAAYGEGFRAPSLGELFYPGSGNADLRPERSRSYELGFEHDGDVWDLAITGFENRLRDLIDFDFVAFRNVNIGRARTRGVELRLRYAATSWNAAWNGTYLDAEDGDSGLDLLRRPQESSNLVLTWIPERWTWSLTGRWVGERADVDPLTFLRVVNQDYLRFDLAARFRLSGHLTPYLRVENLSDEEYAEVAGFPAPGRTLVVGISISQ